MKKQMLIGLVVCALGFTGCGNQETPVIQEVVSNGFSIHNSQTIYVKDNFGDYNLYYAYIGNSATSDALTVGNKNDSHYDPILGILGHLHGSHIEYIEKDGKVYKTMWERGIKNNVNKGDLVAVLVHDETKEYKFDKEVTQNKWVLGVYKGDNTVEVVSQVSGK